MREIALVRLPAKGIFSRTRFRLLNNEMVGRYLIRAGFESDGLSLPPVIRGFCSPTGVGFLAGLLHDHLLENSDLSRKECAHEFRRQLRAEQVPKVVEQLFYGGVRAWDHWKTIKTSLRWVSRTHKVIAKKICPKIEA